MTIKEKRKASKHEPTHSCNRCVNEEFCNQSILIGQDAITISRCDCYVPRDDNTRQREDEP